MSFDIEPGMELAILTRLASQRRDIKVADLSFAEDIDAAERLRKKDC